MRRISLVTKIIGKTIKIIKNYKEWLTGILEKLFFVIHELKKLTKSDILPLGTPR